MARARTGGGIQVLNDVDVRPAGTSWMAVLGGWIATIGAAVLVAPVVGGILARANVDAGTIAPAVPVVVGIFVSYLIGGGVAGGVGGGSAGRGGEGSAALRPAGGVLLSPPPAPPPAAPPPPRAG